MAFKQSKEKLSQEFKLIVECVPECGKEVAAEENLHRFTTQLSYVDAALRGGKITPKQAARQAKDLYKIWKESNKSIDRT